MISHPELVELHNKGVGKNSADLLPLAGRSVGAAAVWKVSGFAATKRITRPDVSRCASPSLELPDLPTPTVSSSRPLAHCLGLSKPEREIVAGNKRRLFPAVTPLCAIMLVSCSKAEGMAHVNCYRRIKSATVLCRETAKHSRERLALLVVRGNEEGRPTMCGHSNGGHSSPVVPGLKHLLEMPSQPVVEGSC